MHINIYNKSSFMRCLPGWYEQTTHISLNKVWVILNIDRHKHIWQGPPHETEDLPTVLKLHYLWSFIQHTRRQLMHRQNSTQISIQKGISYHLEAKSTVYTKDSKRNRNCSKDANTRNLTHWYAANNSFVIKGENH